MERFSGIKSMRSGRRSLVAAGVCLVVLVVVAAVFARGAIGASSPGSKTQTSGWLVSTISHIPKGAPAPAGQAAAVAAMRAKLPNAPLTTWNMENDTSHASIVDTRFLYVFAALGNNRYMVVRQTRLTKTLKAVKAVVWKSGHLGQNLDDPELTDATVYGLSPINPRSNAIERKQYLMGMYVRGPFVEYWPNDATVVHHKVRQVVSLQFYGYGKHVKGVDFLAAALDNQIPFSDAPMSSSPQ